MPQGIFRSRNFSVVATVTAFSLAACGAATGQDGDSAEKQADPAARTSTVDESAVRRKRTSSQIGPARAIKLAVGATKGGKVFDLELDRERGRLVWEADVATAGRTYDVTLDARSGKVLQRKRDRTPDRGSKLLAVAKVRAAKAAGTATAAVNRAKLHSLELDRWRGRVVWEAELVTRSGAEYDLKIHARTGKVVAKKLDD